MLTKMCVVRLLSQNVNAMRQGDYICL